MALWSDREGNTSNTPAAKAGGQAEPAPRNSALDGTAHAAAAEAARRAVRADGAVPAKESLIAAELTIEGKIQGTGSVRLAGRFKGDVHVAGNVAIDAGAKVEGGVQASGVTVGGELTGNIEKARHVEVLQTGVIVGDVKADSLAVAAGSRMRGHVEFGWNESGSRSGTTGTARTHE